MIAMTLNCKSRAEVKLVSDVSALKARFYGHRFSGKARFNGQNCYDSITVFSNSGNFIIADIFVGIFAQKFWANSESSI